MNEGGVMTDGHSWWLMIGDRWWLMDEWMNGWWKLHDAASWCMMKMNKWIWMFLCCLRKCIIPRKHKENMTNHDKPSICWLLWMRFRLYAVKQGRAVRWQLLWSASITRHIYSCMPMFWLLVPSGLLQHTKVATKIQWEFHRSSACRTSINW